MLEPMANKRAKHGYTLVELMIVVSIIGLTLSAAVPAISRRLAENRVREAAYELVRLGRRARGETAAYGAAHLLWIDPAQLQVKLLIGNSSSCINQNWAALDPPNPESCGTPGSACLESLNFAHGDYVSGTYLTRLQFQSSDQVSLANTGTALCYTPSGAVWHGQGTSLGATTLSDLNVNPLARGGYRFMFRVESQADGSAHGPPRIALFPLGTSPMVLQ